jgi:hypothetical protein
VGKVEPDSSFFLIRGLQQIHMTANRTKTKDKRQTNCFVNISRLTSPEASRRLDDRRDKLFNNIF